MRLRSLCLVVVGVALILTPAHASHESDLTWISVTDDRFGWSYEMLAPPGDTLHWQWEASNEFPHTVTAYQGASFDTGLRTTGAFEWVYPGGTILYRCELHSTLVEGECDGMCGAVVEQPAQIPPVITSPLPGTTIDDSVATLAGTADSMAAYLWVYDGDEIVGSTSVYGGGWSAEVGPLAAGTHSLVAVSYDRFGEAAPSEPLPITVDDTTAPGAPAIISPRDGSDVPMSEVAVVAEASDRDTAAMIGLIDGAHQTELEHVYDRRYYVVPRLAEGPHTIEVAAVDPAGNRTWAAPVSFWVDRTDPVPIILSPSPVSAQISPFVISGAASDERAVASVRAELRLAGLLGWFAVDAECDGCNTSSATWRATLDISPGVYEIRAVAYDRSGRQGVSAPVRIVVV
jgi:plastocyanin